ncbi:hypothetical protein GE061_013500 [Apolygus lucorum]|uniref:Kinetochore protein Nuf2 N-terminal domain-containing protein n=1 Tax=Apolygus lucorum TaxID=248454 RepID=A0A8S9XQS2_APOLU|nr:hypothetical protein GE061_013500 [Apolygus lucorum]
MALEHRLLEDIRTFFNNDFAINLSDLQRPTYIFVRDFYCRVLIEFEVDTDNVRKASHLLEGTDNTVEITGDLNLVSAIKNTFGFLQFGLFDLLSPGDNQKRTVTMISNVMEFMHMADELTTNLDFEAYRASREEINYFAEQVEVMRQKVSEIALAKDRILQSTIELKNNLAKTKIEEQQMCAKADAAAKTSNAAKIELEKKREISKAKKAQVDKLKNAINILKEELVGVQSLDVKEEEKKKVEREKNELHAKYMEKVAAGKKYVAALETIKPIVAVAESVFELVDEDGERHEALLSIQKEAADMSQTQLTRKKELSSLKNEIVELEKKLTQVKLDKMNINEELSKNNEILTKKSSELVESIKITKEKVGASDEKLNALKKEADQTDSIKRKSIMKIGVSLTLAFDEELENVMHRNKKWIEWVILQTLRLVPNSQIMRGRVRSNPNALWWCGGSGDIGRYENMTSDCLTTTEDATECTDSKLRNPFRGYPVHSMYSSRVARAPPPYFYPVKKRSRRRFVPLAYYPVPYEGQRSMAVQSQLFLSGRRPSRKSLVGGHRHRAAYTVTQAQPPLPPDQVRKDQKVLAYSTYPGHPEGTQQKAKVFWHKVRKYPGKANVVSWCSQAVDSSTSADAKSVRSNYSRLSVDVSNEMAAMNKDIETILTRYEAAFDKNILNDLEERGLGKKKKHKPDTSVKATLPQLTAEQQTLISMEKPPLDRLGEIPIEYLKPRPPPSASVKEPIQETTNTSSLSANAVWKQMLQDLLNRGIMDKLDDTSLAKMQSALNEAAMSQSSPSVTPVATSLPKVEEAASALYPTASTTKLSGKTCVLQSDEKTVLSEVDKQFQYTMEALKNPTPTYNVNYTRPAATSEKSTTLPNLVERSEDLIPVNKVNDDTNWRKKLEEFRREANQAHCEGCKTLTEQLTLFQRGGSGDKLVVRQDKSVNTDVGRTSKEELSDSCSRNFSSGDRCDALGMSQGSLVQERKHSNSTITQQYNVKEISSNITVTSIVTDNTNSGNTSCNCEELTTNPSSARGMSGVTVEDVEDEELPLQRTSEKTSLGKSISSKIAARRAIKPISLSSQQGSPSKSVPDGTRVAKEGAGDSRAMDGTSVKKELTNLIQDISMGRNSSLGQNLLKLRESISQHKSLIDSDTCLDIIEVVTELMLSNEPVDLIARMEPKYESDLRKMRLNHIRHIQQEIKHIKSFNGYVSRKPPLNFPVD